jgi:hypothetical protein
LLSVVDLIEVVFLDDIDSIRKVEHFRALEEIMSDLLAGRASQQHISSVILHYDVISKHTVLFIVCMKNTFICDRIKEICSVYGVDNCKVFAFYGTTTCTSKKILETKVLPLLQGV